MKQIRERTGACIRIAGMQFRHTLLHPDFWIVVVTLLAIYSYVLRNVSKSLAAMGVSYSIFEIFSAAMESWDLFSMTMIGMLFLISDLPRRVRGYETQVLRVSRRVWHVAQWVYAFLISVLYLLLVNVCAYFFYAPVTRFRIFDGGTGKNLLLPWLMAFVLYLLIMLLFAGVCLVCNLFRLPPGVGILIDSGMIFLAVLYQFYHKSFGLLSPAETLVRFGESGGAGFWGSAWYLGILCLALFLAGSRGVGRTDIAFGE